MTEKKTLKKANKPPVKASNKGALIKGISQKLPRELLDNPLFNKRLRELLRGFSGIYALYNGDKLYYVGLSTNLLTRLRSHARFKSEKDWDRFKIFRIRRVSLLKDIETLIMNIVELPGNKVNGKVPKDRDITKLLNDIVKEESRELNKIKKVLNEDRRRKPRAKL
jgi:hypothetical protein